MLFPALAGSSAARPSPLRLRGAVSGGRGVSWEHSPPEFARLARLTESRGGLMWLGAVLMILAGCALGVIGELGRRSALPRNQVAGLRSAAAMTDDATWRAAHRAAGPWLLCGALVAFGTSAVALIAGGEGWARTLLFALLGLVIACVFIASRFGEQAAKKVLAERTAEHDAGKGGGRSF